MGLRIDVLFADASSPHPYSSRSARTRALGGTEAAVIRVTDGLAALGKQSVIYERGLDRAKRDNCVILIPASDFNRIEPRAVVHVRHASFELLQHYPTARHVLWLHEVVFEEERDYVNTIRNQGFQVGCVSDWHTEQTRKFYGEHYSVSRIYNPLPDDLYEIAPRPFIPHKLVWMSSPHKGLDDALCMFAQLRRESGLPFELHVYNPGYVGIDNPLPEGCVLHGSTPFPAMMDAAADALCVFHPSLWYETFCLVAAEANCFHIPLAGYSRAALNETAQEGRYLKDPENEAGLLAMVRDWAEGARPEVSGNPLFRQSRIAQEWAALLGV